MSDNLLEGMSPEEVQNLAALTVKFTNNPKTRKQFLKMAKELDDTFTSPELEAETMAAEVERRVGERVGKIEEQFQQNELKAKLSDLRMAPVKAGLIKEDEMGDLESYMKDKGFLANQYMQAAQHRQMERQLSVPEQEALAPWTGANNEEVRKDPRGFFRKQALQAVNEIRLRRA